MAEKSANERLRESLERNARRVDSWSADMRTAISTAHVFMLTAGPGSASQTQATDVRKAGGEDTHP